MLTSLLMTYINILVATWKSGEAFRAYGRGNMPHQADKLPISHNNVVGENTVLQHNILETGVLTLVVQNSSPTRLRLNHLCENTSLQNVSVENLQFLRLLFDLRLWLLGITVIILLNIWLSFILHVNNCYYVIVIKLLGQISIAGLIQHLLRCYLCYCQVASCYQMTIHGSQGVV